MAIWNTEGYARRRLTGGLREGSERIPGHECRGLALRQPSTCCNMVARSGCSGQTKARNQSVACGSSAWMGLRSMPTRAATGGIPAVDRWQHLTAQLAGEPYGRLGIPCGPTHTVVVAVGVEQQIQAGAGPDLDQRQRRAARQARHRGEGWQEQ